MITLTTDVIKTGTAYGNGRCPIGPLQAHTWNAELTECIWCGPGRLASEWGHWVQMDGFRAWSATAPYDFGPDWKPAPTSMDSETK